VVSRRIVVEQHRERLSHEHGEAGLDPAMAQTLPSAIACAKANQTAVCLISVILPPTRHNPAVICS